MARTVFAALLAVLLLGAPAAAHDVRRAGAPVLLSGPSPLGPCGLLPNVQRGAEAEPHLAADPADPLRIAVAWQQDRDSTGGAAGFGLRSTADGGRTWGAPAVAGATGCPAAPGVRISDPWLSFGAGGALWLSGIPGGPAREAALPQTRVQVWRSLDLGATWTAPSIADAAPAFNDKETIAGDPARPATAYAAWTVDAGAGWFARTDDGGATWSLPVRVAPGTREVPAIGLIPVARPDGTLVIVYGTAFRGRMRAVRSADGGRTWSAPVRVGGVGRLDEPRDRRGRPIRAGAVLPTVATDARGRVYVAWADVPRRALRLAISSDGGRSFGRTRTVARGRFQRFLPALAVAADGVLGLLSYDLRADRPRDRALTTEVWLRHSHDRGRTWRERRLLGGLDLRRAPRADGAPFVGDYVGFAAAGLDFVAALAVPPPRARDGSSDVLFVRASPR